MVRVKRREGPVDESFIHDIEYDKNKNPQAGPSWDRRLMAAEGAAMRQELQDYVNRREGR